MTPFDPSPVRLAFDYLLATHPHLDVVDVDWGQAVPWESDIASPWVLVALGQRSEGDAEAFATWEFGIWKQTGALHRINGGEVIDPELWRP